MAHSAAQTLVPAAYANARRQAAALIDQGDAGVSALMGVTVQRLSQHGASVRDAVDQLRTLIRLVEAYLTGDYRAVPKTTIVAAVAAAMYFVNPGDLIPDILPGGQTDDLAVILFVVAAVESDLEEFQAWESRQPSRSSVDSQQEPRVADLDELGREIQAALEEDKAAGRTLAFGSSRDGQFEYDGYCAVAAEAYFYLQGAEASGQDPASDAVDWEEAGRSARAAGLQPMQLTLTEHHGIWPRRHAEQSSHWWINWLRGDGTTEVVDLVVGPGDPRDGDFPYEDGHPRGFQQHGYKRPSESRGRVLIDRVVRNRQHASSVQ